MSDKETLRKEVLRERFGDAASLETERDNPVIILPPPRRGTSRGR